MKGDGRAHALKDLARKAKRQEKRARKEERRRVKRQQSNGQPQKPLEGGDTGSRVNVKP
jgi:hypothetical protein